MYLAAFEYDKSIKKRSRIFYGEDARYFIENFKNDRFNNYTLFVCHSEQELWKALENLAK